MVFRSQVKNKIEYVEVNINGVWRTVGMISQSSKTMFHAQWLGVFGVVGKGIGIWDSSYKARKQIEQMATDTIKPKNITL